MAYRLTDSERTEACGEDPSLLCDWVADRTDSVTLARAVDVLVDKPLRIAGILLLAFVVAVVVRRLTRRWGVRLAQSGTRRIVRMRRKGATGEEAVDGNGRYELRANTVVSVLSSLGTVVIWTIAVIWILSLFEIELAPLFAGAGIAGVALGFGAQSVVSDFLSGFFMVFEDQFGVGDVIDVGDVSGTIVVGAVEQVSLRTTVLRDVNGTMWHIRNSEILRVGNKSQLWSRAVLDIDVAYDADIRKAEGVIQRVADELWQDESFTDGDILDPPEVWGVERLGPDGVTLRLVVRTDPAEQWIVARELRLRIKEALDEAGIEIPFPQRTVWVRQGEPDGGSDEDVAIAPVRTPAVTEELVENPD